MKDGIVKWWNNEKGYGFIETIGCSRVFIHYSEIVTDGYKTLEEGESVRFKLVEDNKFGFKAEKLIRLAHLDNGEIYYKDKFNELMDDIDRVMMSISVRKTEYSKIAFDEKMRQPNFSDLNWCFDQLFYLKQNNK